MSKLCANLLEDTLYEVLITTGGDYVNTKPFGVCFKDDYIILNLYPNKTLNNLKCNPEFLIQFTSNPLTYTKSLFNKLETTDYVQDNILLTADYVIYAKVDKFNLKKHTDNYGSVNLTEIVADIIKIKEINTQPPLINRATNKIMDLLINYTRLNFMDNNQKTSYINDILNSESFIKKTGNKLHIESLNIIKKELNLEE